MKPRLRLLFLVCFLLVNVWLLTTMTFGCFLGQRACKDPSQNTGVCQGYTCNPDTLRCETSCVDNKTCDTSRGYACVNSLCQCSTKPLPNKTCKSASDCNGKFPVVCVTNKCYAGQAKPVANSTCKTAEDCKKPDDFNEYSCIAGKCYEGTAELIADKTCKINSDCLGNIGFTCIANKCYAGCNAICEKSDDCNKSEFVKSALGADQKKTPKELGFKCLNPANNEEMGGGGGFGGGATSLPGQGPKGVCMLKSDGGGGFGNDAGTGDTGGGFGDGGLGDGGFGDLGGGFGDVNLDASLPDLGGDDFPQPDAGVEPTPEPDKK
jgi:hypothetical protein